MLLYQYVTISLIKAVLLILIHDIGSKAKDVILSEKVRFHKCCPENWSLLRLAENYKCPESNYVCIDESNYNSSKSVLFSDDMVSHLSLAKECKDLRIILIDVNNELKISSNGCYDRLLLEIANGTVKQNDSKTVVLISKITEDNLPQSTIRINQIRKCCPRGQSYDTQFGLCRQDNEVINEMLLKQLNVRSPYIYEVESNLHCKSNQFVMDLKDYMFSLYLEGNVLHLVGKSDKKRHQLFKEEWCVDHDYTDFGLVVRVCAGKCSDYGMQCVRKCCPIGQHYEPTNCSEKGECVQNINDEILHNVSFFLDNIKKEDISHEVLNISNQYYFSTYLKCPEGRYLEQEWQELTSIDDQNYCIEAFDRRPCGDELIAIAVVCSPVSTKIGIRQKEEFFVSFVTNTLSIVCLTLTLMVYCVLPELKNLHGCILICHLSMMLFARCCLVIAQRGMHNDRLCTMLGYGIYFGFMAAFIWLNVMCVDMWWTFRSVRNIERLRKHGNKRRRFLWYSLYAWSFVVGLTLIMFLLDHYPVIDFLDANIGYETCWFGPEIWPYHIFFVIPMGLMTCTNFVLWIFTTRHCTRVKSEVNRLRADNIGDRAKKRLKVDRAKFLLSIKLWIVMQAGWLTELLSTLMEEPQWLWRITDFFNELLGVFIFLILVLKPKLYYLIKQRLGLKMSRIQTNGRVWSAPTTFTFISRTISSDERRDGFTTP